MVDPNDCGTQKWLCHVFARLYTASHEHLGPIMNVQPCPYEFYQVRHCHFILEHHLTCISAAIMSAFCAHKNIAYRFLSPCRIASAIDISVTVDPCVFTRLFLIFRVLSDDDVGVFAGAGEKEADATDA
jgi:hypothetical protein